ncbi:helix-turn-helix domain-containing protein [Streptomyces durmitorensis]|uniref:Helix-turn-helix domain-containing protein n=1 Tax=Streptomyces durmitorensis TaxID=319947 RepID=A0ABY4PS86_9ACTN|nr:helix-turn-helix domain-containing protein [Streptomyces durmitorensis]UQT55866.1 helix-turn-helix domain-containing protein [Streptomyces durmitorensis]
MAKEPGTTDGAPEELSDLRVLKALAQPRRQQMLQHLTVHGPATSATLARALGLNTGATSYHLRELARYGFVEETAGTGHGRERWWRAVPGDRRFPPRSKQNAETRLVMDELNYLSYAADLELFEQLQRDAGEAGDSDAGPDEWADAFPYSRGAIRLTLPELREFFEEYIALLNRYKRPDAETSADARTVLTRLLAFPAPASTEALAPTEAPAPTEALAPTQAPAPPASTEASTPPPSHSTEPEATS